MVTQNHPSARRAAVMAYDQQSGQLILFGGDYGSGLLGDTWSWDGGSWTQLHPTTSPSPRDLSAMAYSPATGGLVLFGGRGSSGPLDDTWIWEGATWRELSPSQSPPPRFNSQMSEIPGTPNDLLFSGAGNTVLTDTWIWSGATWQQAHSTTHPTQFLGGVMEPDGSQVLLTGESSSTDSPSNWTWAKGTWSAVRASPTPPAASGLSGAILPGNQGALTVGGLVESGNPQTGQTWLFTQGQWHQGRGKDTSPPLIAASAALDEHTGVVILFGGYSTSLTSSPPDTLSSDTWVYRPPQSSHSST